MSSLSSFVDTTVVGRSIPSLQYPSSESLVYGDREALAEEQLAGSTGSSSESISSSLLHAAEVYLQGLDAQLQLQELLRAARQLSPPSSRAPSLEIHFEQPDHTTGSTSVTGSLCYAQHPKGSKGLLTLNGRCSRRDRLPFSSVDRG